MNQIKLVLLFLVSSSITSWGLKIEYTNLISEYIPKLKSLSKSYYQLKSNYFVENFQQKTYTQFLLNRKRYMLKNHYYLHGTLTTKESHLRYFKAYKLSNKIYLYNVKGYINKIKIQAQEVVYDGYKTYQLKKCEIRKESTILRRKDYFIKLN